MRPNLDLAKRLVETLPWGVAGLFNPWRDHCEYQTSINDADSKLLRLAYHLACTPEFIFIGEAPGYQGCRYSGIAFTSERLLGEGAIPRIPSLAGRLSTRKLPFSEPSATIVWKTLYRLGIAERSILWNAVQLHPYNEGKPWSNRTPKPEEIAFGVPAIHILKETFPNAKLVAVGKKSAELLAGMGVEVTATVRHPANGGATEFATGIDALIV
jgi:hypothetical protein